MTYPIPGVAVSTPYGKRGPYWSCNENSSGGVHTGVDFACAQGTDILAPIAGQIRHRSYGSAFGSHQFAISPDPGDPFGDGEVFFAHTTDRLKDGVYVEVGDYIASVGSEGNVSGPHLHMEYHADTKGTWSCSVHDDPQPVLDWQATPPGPQNPNGVDIGDTAIVIAEGLLNGRSAPDGSAPVVTTKAYGDTFTVAELRDGWARNESGNDSAFQSASPNESQVAPNLGGQPVTPTADQAVIAGQNSAQPRIKGIDISSHQAGWDGPEADELFVFVKATEGKSYVNPEYHEQIRRARDAGRVVGHYHWLNDGPSDPQLAWFCDQADVRPGELIAVDWEDSSNPPCSQKDDFIRSLQHEYPDNRVGLYCNRDWWFNHDTTSFAGDFLWIAAYGVDDPGIEYDWTIWQYTDSPYDKNWALFASLEEMQDWANFGVEPIPPEPIPPDPIVDSGVWYSTDYLFPQVKPDPTNPNVVKKGDQVQVTASGGLTARVLPGGPPRIGDDGETLVRPKGYQFDVTGDLVDGWVTGGTNWYSSDYLMIAAPPEPPAKPGWKSTPHVVLSMAGVPGSVSYLQGVMHVNGCTLDDGTVYDPCWIVAQDYNNAGDIRFLKFRENGEYQSWFQVNDAGHGQTIYAYRSAAGNLYVWCGENPAYRYSWQSGHKVAKSSGTKMDYKGSRPMGGYQDRIAFRDATDTHETFYLFDRTDFTDGTNRSNPIKKVTLTKDTSPTQQGWWASDSRIYRFRGSTNEDTEHNHDGLHRLDVYDWNGTALLRDMDVTDMHRSGCSEDEPEGGGFINVTTPSGILAGKREGPASASKRAYVLWELVGLP